MQIGKEKVVGIHYTLRDNAGTVLDSSAGKDPLYYIQGIGNLIPGMEQGLEGKVKGDKLDIKVSPENGYGVRDEAHVQQVPVDAFGGQEVKITDTAGNSQWLVDSGAINAYLRGRFEAAV